MIAMRGTIRTLRLVQWVMLGSIVLYAAAGHFFASPARSVNPTLNYVFTTMGVAIVGIIFVVRRTLVLRSAESLAVRDVYKRQRDYKADFHAEVLPASLPIGIRRRDFRRSNLQPSL